MPISSAPVRASVSVWPPTRETRLTRLFGEGGGLSAFSASAGGLANVNHNGDWRGHHPRVGRPRPMPASQRGVEGAARRSADEAGVTYNTGEDHDRISQ